MDTKSIRNRKLKDYSIYIVFVLLIFFTISLLRTLNDYRNFKSYFGESFFSSQLIISEILELDNVLKEYSSLYLDLEGHKKEDLYREKLEEDNKIKELELKEAEKNIREEAKESQLSEEEIKKQIEEVEGSIRQEENSVDYYYNSVMNYANNIIYRNVNIEFLFKDSSGAYVTNIYDSKIEDEIDSENFKNNKDYYYIYLPSSKLKANNTFFSEELLDIYNSIRNSNYDASRFYRIPKEFKQGDVFYNIFIERQEASSNLYKKIAVTTILGVLVLIFTFVAFRNRKNKAISLIEELYIKIPIDLRISIFLYSLFVFNSLINNVIPYYKYDYYCNSIIVQSFILIILDYYLFKDLILIFDNKKDIGKTLISKIYKYFSRSIKDKEGIKSNKFRYIFILCSSILALFSLWTIVYGEYWLNYWLSYWVYNYIEMFARIYLCIYIIVVTILSITIFREISILEFNTLRIAKGYYKGNLKGKKLLVLKRIENDLIDIEDGFKEALDKAITSEKMKSELITNVSHDLKTPLTSIINYVDLLKEENITDDKKRKYIEVLDMKAKRLKILIEDLFEASKAVSGNMNFQKEDLNIVSLLRQVIGELEEKISEANLNIITKWSAEKVILYLDGRKTFRVYENLLNNIIKYSMKGSRVYIEVINNEDQTIIIMKNISAYELNFTPEEITERFKRGDESRSTEGSGLGLSIAKSIVELQGGEFNIEIDGDLFKVITKFRNSF
ncbi:MAG: GHKL domain-containing protein [Clostridium sartagoforme]|nr:GHKL domain-containing protein [Clostridium sartagoforme]